MAQRPMKKDDIVMRISCDECGKRYAIKNSEYDDYNIYYVMGGKARGFTPKLLCPLCTKKWSRKVS